MQHDVPDIVLVIAVLVILVFILGRILPVTSQGHVVHFSSNPKVSKPMFRIHDILVWIRIRIWIRGSMSLTNGCWSGSCYFRHWPSRWQLKIIFIPINFRDYNFIIFQKYVKSHKEVTNSRNQGFSYYFCLIVEGSGSGSVPRTGSWRPKNIRVRIRLRIRITGQR